MLPKCNFQILRRLFVDLMLCPRVLRLQLVDDRLVSGANVLLADESVTLVTVSSVTFRLFRFLAPVDLVAIFLTTFL